MNISPDVAAAYKVLDGKTLSEAEAMALTELSGNDILDLVSLANKVRDKFAPKIVPCSIINAKSGVCSQNCKFCAQSGHHRTEIESYPLLDTEKIVGSARTVYEQGVRSFGIVTSWYGYLNADDPEFLADNNGSQRVFRGGGWRGSADGCRSANRHGHAPGYRCFDLGFRVALVPVK